MAPLAPCPHGTVGFVPTMGYLHEGHLALVPPLDRRERAHRRQHLREPDPVRPERGLRRATPATKSATFALLREAGVDAVYLPTPRVDVPRGLPDVRRPSKRSRSRSKGASRPGHFRGVATVVLKLFNAVEADRAYFGRKDAQQLRVIQRMARDLDLAVEIVPCDIVREPDGLAMSSRNVYLTPEERAAAPIVYRSLRAARDAFGDGVRDAAPLRALVTEAIAAEPLATIDYVSVADSETLLELDGVVESEALLSVAVRFGVTRLIDNIELG